MKVLIVDDDAGVREAVREILTLPGFDIRECPSSEEAVNVAREFQPDWMTMDLHMPGFDGFEAAALIQQQNPAIRIVILTYEDQPHLRQAAKDAGMTYLVKEKFPMLRDLW